MAKESKFEPVWAIGLMSGTSLDGVDAALIRTDGVHVLERGASLTVPYTKEERALLFECLAHKQATPEAMWMLTARHVEAVQMLLAQGEHGPGAIGVVGFHGQTVLHAPERGVTLQMGDAQELADMAGIPVVFDFRKADVQAGGHGAPLVPLYHQALAEKLEKPLAVVNIGGVANVTWIGLDGVLLAFDTGPGNALLDDWVHKHTGHAYDESGKIAASGVADATVLERLLEHSYFAQVPPKSLDRNTFKAFVEDAITLLALENGAATLLAFTVESIARAAAHFVETPKQWLVTGGGRHNAALMRALAQRLPNVSPVESVGWNGDSMEAEAFAFLAVRSLRGLPLSVPTTTGVREAMTGGVRFIPR
jgi:anhydro-N-acetylmuramic acid kinase